MSQAPSVGRIVHYQSHGSPNGQHKSEPRAVVITRVYEAPEGSIDAPTSMLVDLCVLNPTGMYFDQKTPFAETPTAGHWSWPPRI